MIVALLQSSEMTKEKKRVDIDLMKEKLINFPLSLRSMSMFLLIKLKYKNKKPGEIQSIS